MATMQEHKQKKEILKEVGQAMPKPAKKQFVCRCGYKFSLDTSNFSEVICPWCGKKVEYHFI